MLVSTYTPTWRSETNIDIANGVRTCDSLIKAATRVQHNKTRLSAVTVTALSTVTSQRSIAAYVHFRKWTTFKISLIDFIQNYDDDVDLTGFGAV
jgi:hypothetical protein